MNPTFFSVTAALLLLALSGLVLLKESRQGKIPLVCGLLLLAAVELFDLLALRDLEQFLAHKRLVLFFKSLLPATLLLYGMSFTRKRAGESRAFAVAPLLALAALFFTTALLLPIEQFYAGLDFRVGRLLALGRIGYWYYLGLMIFCIAALVNLESVFAGTRGADRWRVKYEFLGVGAILAALIFYFSQGLLYRAVNMSLMPVRSGVMIAASFLIGYSRLYRGRTANLVVSRQALYRSFTLVAVGIYLLILGLAGEGMKRFNVSFTWDMAIFVSILSGLAFLVLLLSEEIRRRFKVLIAKHFYAHKHDYRQEWLGFSNMLAGCRNLQDVQEAIVDRYQKIFGLRFTGLYTREGAGDLFTFAAQRDRGGLPARTTLSAGLFGYFRETGRVMNPGDGEYTPTEEESAFLRSAEAWLLVPLLAGDRLEAFVVFGRQVVPERLTYEDYDLMKIIGRQAVLSLNNFRLSDELAEAREMSAIAKVSAFVVHDLKNLSYSFSLMLENAEQYIAEPDFQRDMVKFLRNTVVKMKDLIGKLKTFPQKQELKKEPADIDLLARETIEEVQRLRPAVGFDSGLTPVRSAVDITEMRKVILNLLLNAGDAVVAGGRIRVETGSSQGEVYFSVADEGCGMSETFVKNHLFKPFRTTKDKGLGIGLFQCKQIVEGHGGRIEVASEVGKGTVFTVFLPGAVT